MNRSFLPGAPRWRGWRLPRWLTTSVPDVSRQGERIRVMERNIVLPVKAAILLLLTYYLFFANWFDDVYTVREAVLLTVRTFFLIYLALTLVAGIFVAGMDDVPLRLVRELVLVLALIDALFWGALVVVTNGFDSTLYWVFVALIVRNAVSFPQAPTQILLNLIVSCCFVAAGFTEVAVTQSEPELAEETTEPYVLRFVVLLLVTACCYGVQVLFDKQRRVEQEALEVVQRQQQLESAGRLAAEIAHQLKNPLGIINNAAFTLQRTVKEGKTITQQIQIIREEVDRSDRILTELMGYAQLAEGRVERIEVSEELDRAIDRVFPAAVHSAVTVERAYAPALPPLLMQRSHLSEALVNLLQNALEAFHERGTLRVEARAGEDYSVVIRIADNGPGIPAETLPRIFDPYFTTKPKGTGLGLAIVKHNVELYGGRVTVESELGKGTAFELRLPARTVMKLRP